MATKDIESGCIAAGRRFSNEFSARDAVRATLSARQQQLALQANPLVKGAFDKIAAAAMHGEGRIERLFPDCPMEIQLLAMGYLAACGYKTYPDPTGGVVRWYDDPASPTA